MASQPDKNQTTTTVRCATHPNVETNLRCGKCGKPICPKCLVQTPVGVRCRECAQLRRLPQYQVSPTHYAKALAVGVLVGAGTGAVWGILGTVIPFIYIFNILLAIGAGYAIGEAVTLSVNRKGGPGLQTIAALGAVISYVVASFNIIHGIFVLSIGALLNIWGLIALAAAILMAISRPR